MGKLSKKLVVYLDQNFLSEMAKAKVNNRVNRQFTAIYELLHRGFVDEKLVVVQSFFHDLETALAPALREGIRTFQGYLGQTSLRLREEVLDEELRRALQTFAGQTPETRTHRIAFRDDPDQRVEPFKVRGNIDYSTFGWGQQRKMTAEHLDATRERIQRSGISYVDQVSKEFEHFRLNVLQSAPWLLRYCGDDPERVAAFTRSDHFAKVPTIDLFCRMWAKLLVDYRGRPVTPSDQTDVEIISAYLPYVDVLATDNFMANLARNLHLDRECGTEVFSAKVTDLARFEHFLAGYVETADPANCPAAAVFVLSDGDIKKDSWEFFRALGNSLRSCETRSGAWIELYAFDDGDMPRYWDQRINDALPFHGLQPVTVIPVASNIRREEILRLCRDHCRAPKFVLVDSYQELQQNFGQDLLGACLRGSSDVLGYHIHCATTSPPGLNSKDS